MVGRTDTGNAGMTGHNLKIFELVRLIDNEFVHAKLLEGNHVIHPFAVGLFKFFQTVLLIGDEFCDVADGEIFGVCPICPQREELILKFVNGTLPHCRFALCGQLDLLEGRCTNDDRIPVLRSDAGDKLLPIFLLEVLLLCDQNLRPRIKSLKLLAGLRCEVIRNDHECLVRKPHALRFHNGGDHLKCLPRTDAMSKKRIAAEKAVCNRIFLMRLEGNRIRHTGEGKF